MSFIRFGLFFRDHFPQGIFNDLMVNGIIAGLSGVAVFLPQIVILFAFIALLEDTGYMARVSFLMDKMMDEIHEIDAVVRNITVELESNMFK